MNDAQAIPPDIRLMNMTASALFAVFVLGSYGKLLNDAKRNPYTAIRGDDDQWLLGAGLGYTF